jgi:hypothetical protein
MEIKQFRLSHLRNGEHYKFQFDFSQLVVKYTTEALGVSTLFSTYNPLLASEYKVYEVIRKSEYTDTVTDGDILRDTTFSGMAGTVRSGCNHFDAAIRAAAQRLCLVLDHYGNLAVLPYDEETASLMKFIDELRGRYAADVKTLGIDAWVNALDEQNKAFDALKNKRTTTKANMPESNMKQERQQVDDAYRAIVKRINALAEVNGPKAYHGFIKELNQIIDNYTLLVAQRMGRNAKEGSETTPPASPVMQ